jgi:hypothetical protein
LALRSTCTPCAGSCSAVPSLHPRGRNSRCSIWCRASHCTDSPRGHTCLFRAALPWRGSFRPGTCARRRFHGEMQRSGLNTLTGRCVLAEDTDETDCRQRRFGAAGLTADVHSADWLVHSVDTGPDTSSVLLLLSRFSTRAPASGALCSGRAARSPVCYCRCVRCAPVGCPFQGGS